MNFRIDKNKGESISHQLYQQISDRILSGFLKEGEALPSVRKLAKTLNISPMTIIKVYDKLQEREIIEKKHGKGTYVKERYDVHEKNKKVEEDPFQWQVSIPDYLSRSQFRYNPNLSYVYDGFNLSVASLNQSLLPTKTIIKDAYDALENNIDVLGKYPSVQGDSVLREAIQEYLQEKSIHTLSQNILITSGGQQGISLVVNTFVGPGDIVVMETPTYPGAIDLFKCKGATILTVPVDENGMKTDILMSLCDKYSPKVIYTIPNFHNPTGYSMSDKRKRELLDIAQAHNCMVIEDDPWSEISYTDKNIKSLKSMDHSGHVIYIKSISKIIGPAYRIAALVAEGSILSRLIASKANLDLGTPILTQKVVLDFIASKKITKYIQNLNTALLRRRNKAIQLLKTHAPKGTKWTVPEGGISIWITLPRYLNVEKLLYQAITDKKIAFLPGTICYPNEVECNHLRICFSYLEEEHLEKVLIDLCILMKDFLKGQRVQSNIPIV